MDFKKNTIMTVTNNVKDDIERTCEGIVNQTWQDFEWFVVDGSSTDGALFFNPKSEDDLIVKIFELENQKENLLENGYKLAKEYRIENYVSKIYQIIDDFQPIIDCWR